MSRSWLGERGPPGEDLGHRPGQRAVPTQQPAKKQDSWPCYCRDLRSAHTEVSVQGALCSDSALPCQARALMVTLSRTQADQLHFQVTDQADKC